MAKGRATWNYRILDFGTHLALHEVHYTDGVPHSWTETPITFVAHSDDGPQSIVDSLTMALKDANNRPPLKIVDEKIVTE